MARGNSAVIALIALAGCTTTSAGPDVAAARAYHEEGREAADRGEHAEAIRLYTLAIDEHPRYPEAYHDRGYCSIQLRLSAESEGNSRAHLQRAFGDFDEAIRINPAYLNAYFNRAMLLASIGRHKDAAEDLISVLRLNTRDARAHLKLGELYEHKFENAHPRAMQHYDSYVALGGPDAKVREKVRAWRELTRQVTGSKPVPAMDMEEEARDLHGRAMNLLREGRRKEALEAVEELLSKYGETLYVTRQERIFKALLNSLGKP